MTRVTAQTHAHIMLPVTPVLDESSQVSLTSANFTQPFPGGNVALYIALTTEYMVVPALSTICVQGRAGMVAQDTLEANSDVMPRILECRHAILHYAQGSNFAALFWLCQKKKKRRQRGVLNGNIA